MSKNSKPSSADSYQIYGAALRVVKNDCPRKACGVEHLTRYIHRRSKGGMLYCFEMTSFTDECQEIAPDADGAQIGLTMAQAKLPR